MYIISMGPGAEKHFLDALLHLEKAKALTWSLSKIKPVTPALIKPLEVREWKFPSLSSYGLKVHDELQFPSLGSREPIRNSVHLIREKERIIRLHRASNYPKVKPILIRCKRDQVYRNFIKKFLVGKMIKYTGKTPLTRSHSLYLGGGIFQVSKRLPNHVLYEVIKSLAFKPSSIEIDIMSEASDKVFF
jgi:hypothetical protein